MNVFFFIFIGKFFSVTAHIVPSLYIFIRIAAFGQKLPRLCWSLFNKINHVAPDALQNLIRLRSSTFSHL